ncbi:hypothetical protein CesoFtcFv8_017988 [Champsocephalus esox]|uniref:Zinc finger and BTB domain-containing protein 24 n=1 Tax=Champsocephalus esox TaxID=159716 RepID=A0AAN8BLC3_9TELE|nr:hypothetical protein CesoFtcFv8_017988 [Champsocephalus esox]
MSPASNRSSIRSLHSHSHRQSILGKLNTLRQQDLLCDVTLQVHDEAFRAHKALLAASSDHFLFLFTSKPQSVYRLQDVSAETLRNVLQFIYSAQVRVEEDKVCVEEDKVRVEEDKVRVEEDKVRVEEDKVCVEEDKVCVEEDKVCVEEDKVCVEEDVMQQLLAAAKLLQVSELIAALSDRAADEEKDDQSELQELGVPNVQAASKRKRGRPNDADFNPASRQSKRKIRPPVKYKSYRVSGEETGRSEPGKRGRKRKYPDTEARCEDCGKVFKNHLFLKIHQRTHTGEKPFPCLACGKAFTQKHTLLVHQRSHSGEKPFICNVCSKSLSTKHALQEHMHLHRGEKPFGCDQCGKTFTQKRQLKSHCRVHTGKSLPECAQCHHTFMDTAQLKKHLRTHTGEKPFTCEICGKCFTAKSTLQTHIRIHRGDKPFCCSLCSRCFSDSSAKRRHEASHSGSKPFSCSSCSLSFTRLDNLKTHSRGHSKERADPPPEDPPEDPQLHGERGALQQIQLVVTDDLSFVPGQNQEISIITTEEAESGGGASAEPRPQTHPPHPWGRGLGRLRPLQTRGSSRHHTE